MVGAWVQFCFLVASVVLFFTVLKITVTYSSPCQSILVALHLLIQIHLQFVGHSEVISQLTSCVISAVTMSSRRAATRRGVTKKRAQRATSNVFAMFGQAQIQEFKEAFNMIDQNRDGFIDKEDLHDMLASLGKAIGDSRVTL